MYEYLESMLTTIIWFQREDALYVACGPKVIKLDKITGAILQTYSKGKHLFKSFLPLFIEMEMGHFVY